MNPSKERWTGFDEIACYLVVSEDNIRNWIKKEFFLLEKSDGLWEFRISEIGEWVRSRNSARKSNTQREWEIALNA